MSARKAARIEVCPPGRPSGLSSYTALPHSVLDLCFEALDLRELLATVESVCQEWRRASREGGCGWRRCGGGFSLQQGWKACTDHGAILEWLAPRLAARVLARPLAVRGRLHYDLDLHYWPERKGSRALAQSLLRLPWRSGLECNHIWLKPHLFAALVPATLGGVVDLCAAASAAQWHAFLGALGPVRQLILDGSHLTSDAFTGWAEPFPDGRRDLHPFPEAQRPLAFPEAQLPSACPEKMECPTTFPEAQLPSSFAVTAATATAAAIAASTDSTGSLVSAAAAAVRPRAAAAARPPVCDTLRHLVVKRGLSGDLRAPLRALSALRSLDLRLVKSVYLPALPRLTSLTVGWVCTQRDHTLEVDGAADGPAYRALRRLSLDLVWRKASPMGRAVADTLQLRALTHLTLAVGDELFLPASPTLESLSLRLFRGARLLLPPPPLDADGAHCFPALRCLSLTSYAPHAVEGKSASEEPLARQNADAFVVLVGAPALRTLALNYEAAESPRVVARLCARRGLECVTLEPSGLSQLAAALAAAGDGGEDERPDGRITEKLRLLYPEYDERAFVEVVGAFAGIEALALYHAVYSRAHDLDLQTLGGVASTLRAVALRLGQGCSTPPPAALHILNHDDHGRLVTLPVAEWVGSLAAW